MRKQEAQRRLLLLMQERNKRLATSSFSHFLGYINPTYQMEWFHRVIAEHCQMLFEGKIKMKVHALEDIQKMCVTLSSFKNIESVSRVAD